MVKNISVVLRVPNQNLRQTSPGVLELIMIGHLHKQAEITTLYTYTSLGTQLCLETNKSRPTQLCKFKRSLKHSRGN